MTDPRIIIAVLCAAVILLAVALAAITATARAMTRRRDNLIDLLRSDRDHWFNKARSRGDELYATKARLAPFIAKRERGEGGRFVRSEAA